MSKEAKTRCWSKITQQIDFTGNQDRAGNTEIFLIIKEAQESVLAFSKWTVKLLWFYFVLK